MHIWLNQFLKSKHASSHEFRSSVLWRIQIQFHCVSHSNLCQHAEKSISSVDTLSTVCQVYYIVWTCISSRNCNPLYILRKYVYIWVSFHRTGILAKMCTTAYDMYNIFAWWNTLQCLLFVLDCVYTCEYLYVYLKYT